MNCMGNFSRVVSVYYNNIGLVPKSTATITPHCMTICNNVTNMVACPTYDWSIGTSNTSWISFMFPCLRVSLSVGICLLIFNSFCIGLLPWFAGSSRRCVCRTPPGLNSLTCTFLAFVAKPNAGVTSQCVTCGSKMFDLITCPTSN